MNSNSLELSRIELGVSHKKICRELQFWTTLCIKEFGNCRKPKFVMSHTPEEIKRQLIDLNKAMSGVEGEFAGLLEAIHPQNRESAVNFLKYLILRKTDVRELQLFLHENGLSSLASCESHTQRQIQVTLQHLGLKFATLDPCTMDFGSKMIESSSQRLFGLMPEHWPSSVMVTFDSSFLKEKDLIQKLLKKGMGIARINCAHDHESVWQEMVDKIRLASKETGIPCKIHVDLAGPKIRTKLLAKGKKNGKVELVIGQNIWLCNSAKGFKDTDIVISPNEPGVVKGLKAGDRVFIDDGLILGIVEKVEGEKAELKIMRISSKKPFIKAEKGINFPDCSLQIPSLTKFDRECLTFVCANADTVGFSFVRSAQDIADLRAALSELVDQIPFIILKIETHEAVKNLPALLLEGLKDSDMGVMIARGDLAVEIGFERLVEIQDEILWLCEAAHVPVIWATQVLENLHKSGVATRAEVTDAGHAARAECIMINKGKHTLDVLKTLRDILQRSSAFRIKNRLVFRPLMIAKDFLNK
jgi:pyruvate kinase